MNNFARLKKLRVIGKSDTALNMAEYIAQKMKFSVKDFFSKCDQIRSFLKKFTEEILNGKLHFLCSGTFILQHQDRVFDSDLRRDNTGH